MGRLLHVNRVARATVLPSHVNCKISCVSIGNDDEEEEEDDDFAAAAVVVVDDIFVVGEEVPKIC